VHLTTDQKVAGLNPAGVTKEKATYNFKKVSGFFICTQFAHNFSSIKLMLVKRKNSFNGYIKAVNKGVVQSV
jgi:hypothetical protein